MEKNNINILLVEDDPGDARLVSEMLRECVGLSFRMTHAVRIDEALKTLKGDAFDVVLLDLNLPDSRGLDGIERITTQEPGVPVIILTGLDDEALGIQAVRKHAGDYLVKGQITSNILVRSIRYAIEREWLRVEAENERHCLEAVMEALPVGVAIFNAQGGNIQSNRKFKEIWGGPRPVVRSVADYEVLKAWWADTGQPVRPEEWASARAVQRGETVVGQVVQIERFDGARAFIYNSAAPIHDARGQIASCAVAIMDITAQKREEETLSSCIKLYAMSESSSIEEILRFILEEAVQATDSSIGYFHFVHPDQKTIQLQTWSKGTLTHCTAVKSGTHYPIENAGVWVDCIHQKKPIIHNDYMKLPHKKGLPEGHVPIVRDLGVPIFEKEKIVAVLGVGNKAHDYTQHDINKISLLAESASTIIRRKRAEDAVKKAHDVLETRVQQRTAELKQVFEALQDEMDERKQAEEKLKTTNVLLSLFSQKSSRKDYLDALVDLVHSWSGCRCVGIRILDDKGCIPYESYIGFSREFWESENRLSIEHDQCACIRAVTGNPDPQDVSMMTPGGSFHCDDTVAFVGRLSAEEKTRFRGVCIQNGFLSLSLVPIRYGNKVLGTIHLADEERKKLSLPFIEFLESMSPLIGEAINRFNLEDELRESESRLRFLSSQLLTVQEDERKRISAELHDDIAAKLSAIKFSLEKNLIRLGKADDEATQSSKGIISMVLNTIASTRRIMINLRPAMIDDLGILATLNWYCREFEQIFTTIQVEKQIHTEEIEIPDHLKIVIFRIVQEGMHNVAKHSGANQVALTLEKINDSLMLSIEDNGRGLDVENKTLESERFQGFGMVNMEERARFSGGDFSIKFLKGKGTFLKITWPLKPMETPHHLRIEPS